MSLKQFIIKEDLRSEHAQRFLLYQDRYNTVVLLDLKKQLKSDWDKVVNSISKKYKAPEEDVQLTLLKNPNSSVMITVEDKDEKILSSRHREPILVSPSVKIPLIFKKEERDLIIKLGLDEAEKVMKDVTRKWSEIFRVEKNGRAKPWFKIIRDGDEIRFQLALSDEGQEMYKTLYSIRVEYGKQGSKLRDFDRIYLISLI